MTERPMSTSPISVSTLTRSPTPVENHCRNRDDGHHEEQADELDEVDIGQNVEERLVGLGWLWPALNFVSGIDESRMEPT